jgi:hypothetical protein
MMRKLLMAAIFDAAAFVAAVFEATVFDALAFAALAEDFGEAGGGAPGAAWAIAIGTASATNPDTRVHATAPDRRRGKCRNMFGRKIFTKALGVFSTISLERP